MAVVTLTKIIKEFDLEEITSFGTEDNIHITVADCTRPGLQLAGYYDHFGHDRLQLMGNMEMAFLARLDSRERENCLDKLFAQKIPCMVIARHREPFPELIKISQKYQIPLLRARDATSTFMSTLIKYLNIELAPMVSLHGVLVEIHGEGVLILGESGVGKSETAIEIVKRGHRLIADDLVEVRRVSDTTLLGRAPQMLRHLLELRGLGIIDVKELYGVSSVKMQESINFVINLELWNDNKIYERIGINEEHTEILGISVPSITIPVRPGRNLAIIAEVAAINFRQKKMGYNAALELTKRLFGQKAVPEHE